MSVQADVINQFKKVRNALESCMKKHNDYTRRIKPRIKNKYEGPVTITVANEPSRDKQLSTRYENEEEIIRPWYDLKKELWYYKQYCIYCNRLLY